jgi:hypothetical protein
MIVRFPKIKGNALRSSVSGAGAYQNQGSLGLPAVQRSIDVMFGRNRIKDHVVAVRQCLERALRLGEDKIARPEPLLSWRDLWTSTQVFARRIQGKSANMIGHSVPK